MATSVACIKTWTKARLGDLCHDITVGHVGPMASEYTESGVPFLRSQNVQAFHLDLSDVKFISADFHRRLKKSTLFPGDVVVIRTGYPGTASVIPLTLPVSNCADLVVIRPTERLNPYFLAALFNSSWGRGQVTGSLVGAAQQHFNIGAAREMIINLPPLPIQRKIAAILSAYDDLIANNTRRIALLEDLARALYREWFVRFRFPGHEAVPLVDSARGPVPQGWGVVRLGDVARFYRGRSYGSADIVEVGGFPFLNLKCVDREGGFRRDGIKRYIGPHKDSQTAKPGEIIMAVTDMTQERRIVARAARVPANGEHLSVMSMDLVKIVPVPPLRNEYLYGMLRYSGFANEVKQHANGANVLHLNPDRILDYRFPLPAESLCEQYTQIASTFSDNRDVLEMRNENLRQTRDLLLPKLVSGAVDLESVTIELEEVIG